MQPDVPFLTISEPSRWAPNRIDHEEPLTYAQLPEEASGDHPGLAVAAEVAVEMTGPRPQSVQDAARCIALSGASNSLSLVEALVSRLTVTKEEQDAIEQLTLGQSSTQEWRDYRVGVITGTTIHSVYTIMKSGNPPKRLIEQLMGKSSFSGNAATRYGKDNESVAAEAYCTQMSEKHTNFKMSDCGLTIMSERSFIGASLDRKVSCTCHGVKLVEIKCPPSLLSQASGPDFTSLAYVKMVNNKATLSKTHKYYSQVQCQMAVSHVSEADFVIWTPRDILVIPVAYDPDHWHKLLAAAISFFYQHLGPALLQAALSTDQNPQVDNRKKFIDEHVCSICEGVMLDSDSICSENDNSVQCGCLCDCQKWFHVKCTSLKGQSSDDIANAEWVCATCDKFCAKS